VATDRKARIAYNETLFRAANERVAEWEERDREDSPELYFCECADPVCEQKIALRASDYERIRSDSDRFFVVPGHEIPDVETVVERHENWVVIQKDPEVQHIVEDTDPRRHGG
jgi:hypothetical protein